MGEGVKTEKSNYYEDTLRRLIVEYRKMVSQCLEIVGQKIDPDLKDDKLYNALKAKRQAAEDAKWAAKEVDMLEKELTGDLPPNSKINTPDIPKNYAERFAK